MNTNAELKNSQVSPAVNMRVIILLGGVVRIN